MWADGFVERENCQDAVACLGGSTKCATGSVEAELHDVRSALPKLVVNNGATALSQVRVQATGAVRGNWIASRSHKVSGLTGPGEMTACEVATVDAEELRPLQLDATYSDTLMQAAQPKC